MYTYYNKCFTIISIISLLFINSLAISSDVDYHGIVTASKLSCREKPNINSSIIKYFNFGKPLHLIEKTDEKININTNNDYWYKEENSGGWVYGSYLLLTESKYCSLLSNEYIACNMECGGSCGLMPHETLLIGEYYIKELKMYDYEPSDSNPCLFAIIGKYIQKSNSIEFFNPLIIGAYEPMGDICKGKWISNLKHKIPKEYYDRYALKYRHKILLHKDDIGEFYMHEKSKLKISRNEGRRKCNNKLYSDEIRIEYYIFKPFSINEIK